MTNSEQLTTNDFESVFGVPLGVREFKSFIGEGLKPSGPNFNVLNVLRAFIEDNDSVMYIPANYTRGGRKNVDPKVHHGHRHAPVAMEVTDFVSSMERFNFSVRGLKDVMVDVDGDGQLVPRKVFRTYNVIRDGELHIPRFEAKLSQKLYVILAEAGVLYDQSSAKCDLDSPWWKGYVYTIDLTGAPLISTHWAQPNNLKLYDLMKEEVVLTERVKILNKIEKEKRAKLYVDTPQKGEDIIYYEKAKSQEVTDTYEAQAIQYRLKGFKAKLDPEVLAEQHSTYASVVAQLDFDKRYLNYIRFIIRAVIFAVESTKKKGSFEWSEEKPLPRSKKKVVQETSFEFKGDPIVLEKVQWKESVPVS